MIGVNNIVQWINEDIVSHSVVADDKSDPDFYAATRNNSLLSGATFKYTFTKPEELGYHMVPHPHMGELL